MNKISIDKKIAVVTARCEGCSVRSTRLTNAFSKKMEINMHSVALYYMYYNFARVHQTLRVTPAMEAGISSHVWSIQEIISLSLPASAKLVA
jgi:hypothetical protein